MINISDLPADVAAAPRCEAEVTHGNAIVAHFDRCARTATRQVPESVKRPEPLRWVCTQHGKAYDRGSLNGWYRQ